MKKIAMIAAAAALLTVTAAQAQKAFDFPNHHLHNFYVSERTYEHAVAMGYRLVPSSNAVDRDSNKAFERLGLIRNHNSHILDFSDLELSFFTTQFPLIIIIISIY